MLPDAFGCVVANRFGNLLDDDADPFDLISEVETETDKKKKNKEQEMKLKQKKTGQKESQKDRRFPKALDGQDLVSAHKQQQTGHAPGTNSKDGGQEVQRGMKRGATGQRRVTQEEQPLEFSISKPSDNESNFRGRGGMRGGGGRRGARGGGYTRNPDYLNMRGKREYDRHNGTGISPEEKRGGRGPWNWGCVEEAASELMEVTSDAAIKSEEPQIPVEEDNLNRETDENKEMVVEVAMEMTLDEWKALQETSRPKAEFNIRKTDHQIPSKAKVIHQSKHLGNLKETMEDEGNFLRRSVNDITSLLDINFGSVGRPSRGGRGRGRGAQSTRLERAEQIMEREDDLAPNPDDPEDFPALSAGR